METTLHRALHLPLLELMSFVDRMHVSRLSPRSFLALATAVMLATAGCQSVHGRKVFTGWPAGDSPKEIGKRVAERFVASPHMRTNAIVYPETCAWYGALTFAELSGDKDLTGRLMKRFDPLLTSSESRLVPQPRHVDYSVFGVVPLQIYLETREQKYLALGLKSADRQWADPTPEGLTSQTRFWVDDMFMITAVQVQAYRATRDAKYLDRAALEMTVYLEKLQQTNGLFYHAPDVPFFWGRGDGWFAVGMAEMLSSLPQDHPRRARIMAGYRKMMAALLRYQGSDGMWRQLIDHPEAWPETSCTGMFTFALITGVKNGWLDEKSYGEAARKGWLGLITYLNPNGDIREVCEGTNKKNNFQYYLDRKRKVGDLHGQAPILWCASALLR
jgi:unsaturated rhamnogalacturonyl hydrolase